MECLKTMLIYPYFLTGVNNSQVFPPLGIAQLSAIHKQQGTEVRVLDCTFSSFDDAVASAETFDADVVGIYVMATMTDNALRLLHTLRDRLPGAVYTAGGPMPTLYPARFARDFDFVFRGEAAGSFPDFCRDLADSGDRRAFIAEFDPALYPGIVGPNDKWGPPPIHLSKQELDACPIPDRSAFDHWNYQRLSLSESGRKTTTIMTTYGCPYECDFCSKPIFGKEVRFRSLDRIAEEIADILSYGYDDLWIADDLFTLDENFLGSFCRQILQERSGLTWSCLSRVDSVRDETAALMKRAGCRKVYLGIESGSDEILKLMKKRISKAEINHGVEIFRRNGIPCSGFFIVGYPGETRETIEETFAFALSLGLDELAFNVPYPLPGSKLYERLTGIREEDWTSENEVRFLYDSDFSESWIRGRIRDTTEIFRSRSKISAGNRNFHEASLK